MEKSKSFVQGEDIHDCVQVGQSKRKINAKICDGGEPSVKKRRATGEEMVGPAWSAELRSLLHKVDQSGDVVCTNVMLSDIKDQLTVMQEKMSNFEAYIKESKDWMACIGNKITSMEAGMIELNERLLCVRKISEEDTSLEDEMMKRTSIEFLDEFCELDSEEEDYEDCLNVTVFHDWHNIAVGMKQPMTTPLPLQVKTAANATWFNDILNPKGWLSDDHVNVLLNLIIFKAKYYIDSFLKDWTMLDIMGTGFLMQENFELVHSLVLSYVQGFSPREGARSWVKANRVIAVAKICKNYWVCLEISFELQRITVYDSMFWTLNWPKVKEALKNMTKSIPWICKQEKIWEKKGLKTKLREEWELVSFENTPPQRKYYDCGIMSIKFAECLVSSDANAMISSINQWRCGIYRRIFCGRLYQLGDFNEYRSFKDLGLLHDLE